MSAAERAAAEAAAAAQLGADAAIAEVAAAQLDPDDPLNAARLQLEEALRAAVAMQRGMGALPLTLALALTLALTLTLTLALTLAGAAGSRLRAPGRAPI